MNKLFEREFWIDILISIVLAIIGIVLIAKPETTLNTIAGILGALVSMLGLAMIIKYFIKKEKIEEDIYYNNLVLGIMMIIIGIMLFIYINIIESLLRIIIGLWIIYTALIKLIQTKVFKDINKKMWIILSIILIIVILFGLYIGFYSGSLIKILGILILIYAIIDIILSIIYKKQIE